MGLCWNQLAKHMSEKGGRFVWYEWRLNGNSFGKPPPEETGSHFYPRIYVRIRPEIVYICPSNSGHYLFAAKGEDNKFSPLWKLVLGGSEDPFSPIIRGNGFPDFLDKRKGLPFPSSYFKWDIEHPLFFQLLLSQRFIRAKPLSILAPNP